jgi:signal transduction histidine kinase
MLLVHGLRTERRKAMAGGHISDVPGTWLATTPASLHQRRFTLATMGVLLFAFLAGLSLVNIPLPRSNGFIPYIQAMMFVTDLITAIFLFAQFSFLRSSALLVLASGYFFTALITVAHTLAFPGAFAPDGLLDAGLQTTGWLYVIWHFAFPAAAIAYAWLKDKEHARYPTSASAKKAIFWSVAIVAGSVFALTWGLIGADEYVPRLLLDDIALAPLATYSGWLNAMTCVVAFLLLWLPQGSVLDRWLMVAIFATLVEMIIFSFVPARFSVGWYLVRLFGVIASTVVFLALLTETMRLYAKLAASTQALMRERDNKLLSARAVLTAIAHETRQPLMAIVTSSGAGLKFLQQTPPNLDKARSALQHTVTASHSVNGIFEGIGALFGKGDQTLKPVDLNRIVLDVLQSLQDELRSHSIETKAELAPELPLVSGHSGQLREVLTNLVQNALEAMNSATNRSRVLRVTTELHNRNEIAVTVEDSGAGIDPARLSDIFGAFVTTKAQGTGLGLAISRMIVEHHGGQLTASSDGVNGARFEFVLPIRTSDDAAARVT